jgi:hypothetical protein
MAALGDAATLVIAVTAAVVAAAGYVQFVLKRSVLPSAEFDVQFSAYARGRDQLIGEVDLVFRNAGTSILIVSGVRSRVRYRRQGDAETFALDFSEPSFLWRVDQPGVLAGYGPVPSSAFASMPSVTSTPSALAGPVAPAVSAGSLLASPAGPGWLSLVRDRTFVQPGVTQHYRKPIALPADAQLVHIWASFDYYIELSRTSRFLIRWLAAPPKTLDWRDGVSNHTVRRTFLVPADLPDLEVQSSDSAPLTCEEGR